MSSSLQNNRNVLVTGGAGYIGSHTCKILAQLGFSPVAYDDLSVGHAFAVRWGPLVIADIEDAVTLSKVIRKYGISAVMHFAASASVGESFVNPRKYFQNNVTKAITMLDCLLDEGINTIILSSTCATYGIPDMVPIGEQHPQRPINPYGESKLALEKILQWYGRAYDLKWVSLRYFNAAGADPGGEIGESHQQETHLIPLAIRAALSSTLPLRIFGTDYSTHDGTAVRDYVHVNDLAAAHVLALQYLDRGNENRAFNLGSGCGRSVAEVITAVEAVSGRRVLIERAARRAGDPAELVADSSLAKKQLCWTPQHSSLQSIVSTAWKWASKGLDVQSGDSSISRFQSPSGSLV